MILVTGSTGQLGRLVIEQLLARVAPDRVVAGARNPAKAADLAEKGVSVRALDYHVPETVAAAMKGIERVLLISSSDFNDRPGQHRRVIEAAKSEGVELVAYTSILRAPDSPMILAQDHRVTEEALREVDVPHAVLRNGWYSENYLMDLPGTIERGVMIGAAGEGRVSPACRADLAEAAAIVVSGQEQAGKVYELGGDEALSYPEVAQAIAEAAGQPVIYQDMPPTQYAAALEGAGVPGAFAGILADSDLGVSKGLLEEKTGTLRGLLGRPTTSFGDVVRQMLS